jgi:hypothetical protein
MPTFLHVTLLPFILTDKMIPLLTLLTETYFKLGSSQLQPHSQDYFYDGLLFYPENGGGRFL